MKSNHNLLAMACALAMACVAASAADDASKLGKELTPLGGERAGNADGTLPAWQGYEAPATGYAVGKFRGEYFKHKDEKPLFSIDASNVDKYAAKLTPGQVQLLKQIKGYRMDVYPTHRNCDAPAFVDENTKKNVGFARVGDEGWYLKEAWVPGVPFPFPKTGVEVMLNGKYHYHGIGVDYKDIPTAVSPRKGATEWIKAADSLIWYMPWAKKGSTQLSTLPPVEYYINFSYTEPAALAGQALNVTMYADKPGSETFYYFPGQRRVRRMPTYAYDAPQIGFENQYTMDEPFVFMGPMDRFDWKLVTKKEVYVPYNSFDAYNYKENFYDFAKQDFIDPKQRRYELHRVWVVEATVKHGMRHTAPKRTYYIDEDSWTYLAAEDYDARGNIWKVREGFQIPIWELHGACDSAAFVQYNLSDNRYMLDMHAVGVGRDIIWMAEPSGPRFNAGFYTSDNLRAISER